ncbi:short palate, lung and nasal epithelium carcinoma-associated protein 2A-like [Odocoileus virginianus]|uniref:Short palate, lung and nasal epithelium carcinoma-associated protein 2A-like n=1 Tax=Odocoileus virginianus TaxID=9874 RepID=A0ABM4HZ39_ODOVR
MGSSVSQPQAWTPALCSDDRIIFSLRNPSYPSLWSYPYFDLVALTSKCYRFLLRCQDKMFQLWKLVLLCGLLAGTSASLLDNIGKDVLRKLKSGLEEGLDNLDSTLETILGQLKTAEETRRRLRKLRTCWKQLISGIFQVVDRLTGLKISNLHILDITFKETSDGKGAIVKVPITAEVNVNLPVLGKIVDLALNLVLQFCVGVETDEDTGDSKVVVEECRSDQHSISLSVLGRRIKLFDEMLDFVINLVNEALSLVTHYESPKGQKF